MSDAKLAAICSVVAAVITTCGTLLALVLKRRWKISDDAPATTPAAPSPAATADFMTDDYIARLAAEVQKNETVGDECVVNDGSQRS
jgi:hypothetical protein